jgi:hypothetical protein
MKRLDVTVSTKSTPAQQDRQGAATAQLQPRVHGPCARSGHGQKPGSQGQWWPRQPQRPVGRSSEADALDGTKTTSTEAAPSQDADSTTKTTIEQATADKTTTAEEQTVAAQTDPADALIEEQAVTDKRLRDHERLLDGKCLREKHRLRLHQDATLLDGERLLEQTGRALSAGGTGHGNERCQTKDTDKELFHCEVSGKRTERTPACQTVLYHSFLAIALLKSIIASSSALSARVCSGEQGVRATQNVATSRMRLRIAA